MFRVLQIDHVELFVPAALFEGQPAPSSPTAAFRRVAFRVTAEGFAAFLQRLPDQQAYSIYFVDADGHQLEVTTYEYDDTSARLST